ncbi:NepR family anti-sigma factor [Microvirga sp. CF3062]|uniref:NepR family anti-sigma factor n=1 Tax=Microvirga sp. CF3062 TaxID=3110182 RepID=UPI003FA5B10D
MSTEGNPDRKVTRPRLGPDAREHIGAHLQIVYAEIEGQPIPDEQVDLLLALRRAERELSRKET